VGEIFFYGTGSTQRAIKQTVVVWPITGHKNDHSNRQILEKKYDNIQLLHLI